MIYIWQLILFKKIIEYVMHLLIGNYNAISTFIEYQKYGHLPF